MSLLKVVALAAAVTMPCSAIPEIGSGPPFDPAILRKAITFIKARKELPEIKGDALNEAKSTEPLPELIAETAREIQEALLGRAPLEIVPTAGCEACTDSKAKNLFINPSFLREISKAYPPHESRPLIDFIIAHEISHYAYEIYAKENGASPHGNPPLFQGTSEVEKGERGHAEMDAFALIALQATGRRYPRAALSFLRAEDPKAPASFPDSETMLRIRAISDFEKIFR